MVKRRTKTSSFRRKRLKKTSMPTLKRQTTKNTRAIAQLKRNVMPIRRFYDTDSGTIGSSIHVDLLTAPNNWSDCFMSHDVPGTDLPRQYQLNHIRLKWACQCESNSSGNQWLQIFLVSLKPKVAAKVIERTTRLSAMENEVDYIMTSAGSSGAALQGDCFFMLNPAYYTTHYASGVRRIGQTTMEGTTGDVTNIRDSTTRGTASIKFKRTLKNDEYNEDGFKAINFSKLEPRNHLYLVMFSNAQETSEIFLTYNALYTGRCAAPQ